MLKTITGVLLGSGLILFATDGPALAQAVAEPSGFTVTLLGPSARAT